MKYTRNEVLKKCRALLRERPQMNGTELAIAIAGGHSSDSYRQVIGIVNDLANKGAIARNDGTLTKVARRVYECTECGHRIITQTNHRMEIYPECTGRCRQIWYPHTENERVTRKQTAHKFIEDYKGGNEQ